MKSEGVEAESRIRIDVCKTSVEIGRERKGKESLRGANWAKIDNVLTSGKGFVYENTNWGRGV